ncbi:helix-turn-helix domain-containing protein [Microbacterium sp. S1037]|uniref:helix-turn-helix domain-containing protein n=1 Tax=Microbacterium sp. S1037 TaxID=3398227 RepID=UPI003AADDEFC
MDVHRIDDEFGPAIRVMRQDLQMSQDELAQSVTKQGYPMSQATVGKIERGERRVTVGEAEAFARALQTTIRSLLMGRSYLSSSILMARLGSLRADVVDSLRAFESGQQLAAMSADRLVESRDMELLRNMILESAEDVLSEYRRDRVAENAGRRIRDEMDGPVDATPAPGLFGEFEKKFGDTVELRVHPKAAKTMSGIGDNEGDG